MQQDHNKMKISSHTLSMSISSR